MNKQPVKTILKKVAIGFLAVLVMIQFIRPERNQSSSRSENDISKVYAMPENIQQFLVKKCYDCHSNNTEYPWYANIQPVGWWLSHHVEEGKEHLDFSEFKTYSAKRAAHKLEELGEVLVEDEMPLKSYTLVHRDAVVTAEEVTMVTNWISSLGVVGEGDD
jgi:hypothetical protein